MTTFFLLVISYTVRLTVVSWRIASLQAFWYFLIAAWAGPLQVHLYYLQFVVNGIIMALSPGKGGPPRFDLLSASSSW
ncbi:MAG TPA: hypothetical protein VJ280_01255 [Dehalococcoidales bacterium]|nr:hypothetical protein [Dehalococcoidales bacterium]